MDVSFTNVLEGARQYFQGLPTATASDGPYFQQNVQPEQSSNQQQVVQQQQHAHQQTYFQQGNEHYAGSTTATTGSSNYWLHQHSPSESNRPPTRERTPVQRPSSHNSAGSRPSSHSSQYQEVSRQYQSPYQQLGQEHPPTSHTPQAAFQFPRPQSRDVPSNQQHQHQQHNVTNSTYHQSMSPQLSRPSSREQLTAAMPTYQHPQSSGLPTAVPSQHQYNNMYQSRSYYPTSQSQSLTTKAVNSYLPSQSPQVGSQQMYYKQGTSTSQMVSVPLKQSSYHVESRGADVNTQNNGQYQTSNSNEQAFRATHNLPPIAALSSYHPNKTSKDATKMNVSRSKVPLPNPYSASGGQSLTPQPSAIQYNNKTRSDPYSSHSSTSSYNLYNNNNNNNNNALNQNSQRINQQVSTVITQTYTNVIMTASNATHYNTSSNQNHNPSTMSYHKTKVDMQSVPKSQPNQNIKYFNPKTGDHTKSNIHNVAGTSVIKQRKESPLDLSVKTVRTTADSTEGEAARGKCIQSKTQSVLSNHNYPTLDVNSIERSLTQRSQLPTATAPKVEFHPNFKFSSRHSNWNPSKTVEDSSTKHVFPEAAVLVSTDYNKHMTYQPDRKNIYPPNSIPNNPQYLQKDIQKHNDFNGMYPYDGRDLTAKRPGQVESPAIPTKIAKLENWRESIDLQIEEKFFSHYKQQQLQAQQQQHPHIQQPRVQSVLHLPKMSDNAAATSNIVNGNHSQPNIGNIYNYPKQPYTNFAQQSKHSYNKTNNSYQQSKHSQPSQSYVPSPISNPYTGYFNTPNQQAPHLYINPAARPNNSNPSLVSVSKPNISTGADQRVLNLLRNSIEIKGQKKIEQQKSQELAIIQRADVQHPNTDVTAPLQPKPGIDRNNISPFTPISVPDPNICRMPPKTIAFMQETHIIKEIGVINKASNEESTVIISNSPNNDYDGLAARIRTKGELKEVAHTQSANSNATRDARIQAFLEDTLKSPHRQGMLISSSSSISSMNTTPPKLLKERQSAFPPRKRLFSRNDDDSVKQDVPMRNKSGLRSSSETSVFDFPDSEDENEMPVLERQTLDAMRKDRRNSLKQSTPLHCTETEEKIEIFDTPPRPPSPEDDIFGSICDKFVEQLKSKPSRRIKRTMQPELDVKLEPPEETTSITSDIKIKIEAEEDFASAQAERTNINIVPEEKAKILDIAMENCKTPLIGNVIKSDSDMSDSEIKSGERLAARHKHRVRRKILSSSDSSDNENDSVSVKVEKQEEPSETDQKCNESIKIKTEDSTNNVESGKVDESSKVDEPKVKQETDGIEVENLDLPKPDTETTPRKSNDVLPIIRPAKKPSFGDGSDFYPGWEEGVYKYKKSLRMPPSLIQSSRPPMRLSTSLPDLDPCPQSPTMSIITDAETTRDSMGDNRKSLKKFKSEPLDSDTESTSSFNVFCKKTNYDSEGASSVRSLPNTRKENMSILDRLLEKCGGKKKRKHKRKDDHSPKVIPKSENSIELLATPTPSLAVSSKSPEKSKGPNTTVISATSAVLPFRKDTVNHFKDAFINSGNSILGVHDKFTTIVLSSRTRKETRAMKQRATIKEVFGEDRPASAPPVTCINDIIEAKKVILKLEPFSKNLEEILIKKEKLSDEQETKNNENVTPNSRKTSNNSLRSTNIFQTGQTTIKIKEEIMDDDDENKKLIELVVKKDPDACSETMSLDSEETSISGKRRNKYGKMRRKLSSGFDYIRKKKKIKKEEPDNGSVERKKKKGLPGKTLESIDDIQKEIKSWVLNKGIGESHLHRAARLGYVDITAYCLEKMDSSPSPRDNAGYTPLHEACARGQLEIAKLLLRYGANVHESAKGGIRPLHEAIENGFVEIVRLLLAYGADPSLATYAGVTPLSLANDDSTIKLLNGHLSDKSGDEGPSWPFYGPASCFDPEESGYDVFSDIPQETSDLEIEDIEFDMSEALLPNLYTLRGESSTDRWVLLQDLSHFLKIKSRDALLRQISPAPSSIKVNYKNVLRELKMSDFLEQAHCCQFLNMGEKINNRASKIALVKYTDRVKELLGIETAVVTAR